MSGILKFICEDCGIDCSIDKSMFKKRKHSDRPLCKDCYSKLVPKWSPVKKEHYPEELWDILDLDVWDIDRVIGFEDRLNTKKRIRFECEICHNEEIMKFNEMKSIYESDC